MAYESKDVAVRNNQLKVQEVNVTLADAEIAVDNGADLDIQINEAVKAVHQVLHVASAGTLTSVAASACTIITSASGVASGAIKVAGKQLAAGDKLCVKYELV
jgi:hypothetical protein